MRVRVGIRSIIFLGFPFLFGYSLYLYFGLSWFAQKCIYGRRSFLAEVGPETVHCRGIARYLSMLFGVYGLCWYNHFFVRCALRLIGWTGPVNIQLSQIKACVQWQHISDRSICELERNGWASWGHCFFEKILLQAIFDSNYNCVELREQFVRKREHWALKLAPIMMNLIHCSLFSPKPL